MKDKLLLALYVVILGSVVYFCTRKKTPVKKVAIRGLVLDSIYSKNKSFLTTFGNELENIDVVKNFKNLTIKNMDNDSKDDITDLSMKTLTDSVFLDKEYQFSEKTTALVSRMSNLNLYNGIVSDSVIASKKYPFNLEALLDTEINYTEDNSIWEYHLNHHYQRDLKDSIYAYEKHQIIEDAGKYLKQIKEVQYIVVITEQYFIKPKMSTAKDFESGLLITTVDVYRIKDKKKVGHKALLVTNSDKVNVLPYTMDNKELEEKLYYKFLEMDLAQNRSKKVADFLERQKTKETY